MRGLTTDHVISGPKRGLEKKRMGNGHQTNRPTEKQTNSENYTQNEPAPSLASV